MGMVAVGVTIMAALFYFYARPYAQAKADRAASEPANLAGALQGEAILSLLYGAVMVIAGVFVARAVARSYSAAASREP